MMKKVISCLLVSVILFGSLILLEPAAAANNPKVNCSRISAKIASAQSSINRASARSKIIAYEKRPKIQEKINRVRAVLAGGLATFPSKSQRKKANKKINYLKKIDKNLEKKYEELQGKIRRKENERNTLQKKFDRNCGNR